MATRKIFLSLFALFILFSIFSLETWASSEEEDEDDDDECFECSTKVNTSINLIRDMLISREPLKIDKNVLPCSKCNFTGIKTLESNKNVCPKKGGSDDDVYYDHYLELRFVDIVISCECALNCNPRSCSDGVSDRLTKLMKDFEEAQKSEGMENDENDKFRPISDLQSEFCPDASCSDGDIEGPLEASWPDVIMGITLRAWENGKHPVKTIKVNFVNKHIKLVPRCGDEANPFHNSCVCLLQLNYPMLVFKEVMEGLFPKEGDVGNTKENEEMMSMLTCMDAMK